MRWLLYLVLVVGIWASPYAQKECQRVDKAFKEANYLIQKYQNYKGAFTLTADYIRGYNVCSDKYLQDIALMLYKLKMDYPLKSLLQRHPTNPHLAKALATVYKDKGDFKNATKYYKIYLQHTKQQTKPLEAFLDQKYHSKWAKLLNDSSKIPKGKFKNVFYDYKSKQIIKTTYTTDVGFSAFLKIYGHDLKSVVSYSIANVDIPTDNDYTIDVKANGKYRIIIDDKLIVDGTRYNRQKYTIALKKGTHKVEAEYLGNMPFKFAFDLKPKIRYYSIDEIKNKFEHFGGDVWLLEASVRYRHNADMLLDTGSFDVNVTLEQMTNPTVLFISSLRGKIKWHFKDIANLKAIVVQDREFLDRFDTKVPVYYLDEFVDFSFNKKARYSCYDSKVVARNDLYGGLSMMYDTFGVYPSKFAWLLYKDEKVQSIAVSPRDITTLLDKIQEYKQECKKSKRQKPKTFQLFKGK